MPKGTVKRIPAVKNYGFVVPEHSQGEEVFFHRSAVANDGFEDLRQGQRVTFEVVPDSRNTGKQQAIDVKPADS